MPAVVRPPLRRRYSVEMAGAPKFPQNPCRHAQAPSTPEESGGTRLGIRPTRPRLRERPGLLRGFFRGSIAWLDGWLSTLRSVRLPAPHARLACGCWLSFAVRDLRPQGSTQRFQSCFSFTSLPPLASFAWRNPPLIGSACLAVALPARAHCLAMRWRRPWRMCKTETVSPTDSPGIPSIAWAVPKTYTFRAAFPRFYVGFASANRLFSPRRQPITGLLKQTLHSFLSLPGVPEEGIMTDRKFDSAEPGVAWGGGEGLNDHCP